MTASDQLDRAHLNDAAYVFGIRSAIRSALGELTSNPLDPDAGARVRSLLGEPSTRARAALGRLESARRQDLAARPIRLVPAIADEQVGA